jgi:putative ABC transport system permease protein
MKLLASLRSFFGGLIRRERVEKELEEELRGHIERRAEDLQRSGMTRAEAGRRARIEFGGRERFKEECREALGTRIFDSLMQDVKYGFRTLRKSPGFTAVAVLTLALGIGVNAAIFGLVDSALLSALPFRQPERLVHIWTTDATGESHTPLPEQFAALSKYSQAFEQIAGMGWVDDFYGSNDAGWQDLSGAVVSSNWLTTLGVRPYLGRNFLEEEQAPARDAVVLLSYRCWRMRFHGDREIVGKRIFLNRRSVAVVGVLPPSLESYYEGIEIFSPLVPSVYAKTGILRAGVVRVQIVARLKPGVTLEQARSETQAIARELKRPSATADRSGQLIVEQFADEYLHPGPTMQNARRGLWIMAGAAGVVLLIACANVASLLLARGIKRYREVAVRASLGCSRGRMIGQFLTESTLLFVCGGSLGLLSAYWSEEIVTKAVSGLTPNVYGVEVNLKVLAVGLATSLLSALAFGLIPAIHTTRVSINDTFKDALPATGNAPRSRRPRNLFVVFQIALGMVLLVGFGLLVRSFVHAENAPFGFDSNNVMTATVRLPLARYADPAAKARLMRDAIERVTAMPGVESAGIADSLPMEGADSVDLSIEPISPKAPPRVQEIWFLSVSPSYFSTLKVPLVAGRAFQEQDSSDAPPVAIINRKFAEVYFAGVDPIGYHVAMDDSSKTWRRIVDVIADFRQRNPEEDLRPLVYFPAAQTLPRGWSMAIRMKARGDLASATQGISNWLRPLDPQLYWEMGSVDQLIHDSESLTLRRPILTLLASFGTLALLLAIVGVFGVTSYSVSERTREIGIRVALGAARGEIARLVLRETLAVTFAGLALGTLAAFALSSFLPTGPIGWSGSGIYLYGVTRTDAITYTFAAIFLMSVVLAACCAPARAGDARGSHDCTSLRIDSWCGEKL